MYSPKTVFVRNIISSQSLEDLNIINGFIAIQHGKITKIGSKDDYQSLVESNIFQDYNVVKLPDTTFIMPGFVECHTHAPQYPNIGLGLDRPLLQWLEKYTFPLEKKYHEKSFAAEVYDQVVRRLLKNGTTTACYFGSLSLEGTLELVSKVNKYQQRALVGKVSMNVSNDAGYFNTTEKELKDVEAFITNTLSYKNDLILPIITPRFAVSCDADLMTNLAKIAKKYDCHIQSHISENTGEIEVVLKMFPECKSYTEVYDKCNILTNKCIMAHAVHLSDDEMSILSKRGVSVAHCPASNTRLMSGLCPLRRLLQNNITVGLGTDVSGGDNATILDAMRRAMDVSSHLKLIGKAQDSISWKEAFYLATLGGAKALNLDHKIGNFEVGKEFDALVVNVYSDGAIDKYDYSVDTNDTEKTESLLQRFIYLGDDRNIEEVYVKGVKVK